MLNIHDNDNDLSLNIVGFILRSVHFEMCLF